MQIITSKGEQLSFPHIRVASLAAIGWVAGIYCGWAWSASKSAIPIETFTFGLLFGFIMCCGLMTFLVKK